MSGVQPSEPATEAKTDRGRHPLCPTCGVPMWLIGVPDNPNAQQQMFECKVCDGKALLPRLE